MPLLQWNDSLNLDIAQFDEHHRHLVSLINMAHDTLESGTAPEAVFKLLNELVDYATYHFAAEEFWMREYGYPRLGEHAREHEDFCVYVIEQEVMFEAGGMNVLTSLISFLSNWLVDHIQKSDGAYGVYARSIGATHSHDHLIQPPSL
jgi:hemerythrin